MKIHTKKNGTASEKVSQAMADVGEDGESWGGGWFEWKAEKEDCYVPEEDPQKESIVLMNESRKESREDGRKAKTAVLCKNPPVKKK